MANDTAIQMTAPSGGQTIVPVSSEDEMLEALEKRNRLLERILGYAISVTHKEQWTNLGGKPWPTGPACEAMARRCAVSWGDVESEKSTGDDERGKFYSWTYRARFRIGRDEITAEGHCSSRDQFLGTGTGEGDDRTRELYEVDEGNIRQAAYTNMIVNGVTRILGVRNLSWERLEGLLGAKRDEFASAEFRQGSRGGGKGASTSDKPIPYGRSKGRKLSDAPDDDLAWLLRSMQESVADPEKAKWKAGNEAWVKAIEAEQARRANAKAGGNRVSPWDRIRSLDVTIPEDDLKALVKRVTGKTNAKELDDADIEKVSDEIADINSPSPEEQEDIHY
jgi:hypothetical protein